MAKTTKRKTSHAQAREQTVNIKLSGPEYQLIAYAASKSNIRGINVWMRTKLLDAAKDKLNDTIVAEILEGRATTTLLKASLSAARKRPDPKAESRKPKA